MITVTETRYLDGTGDVPKDVEYVTANEYTVMTGDNKGDLVVYRTVEAKPLDLNPSAINYIEPTYETLAYYRNGSYSKVLVKN